VDAWNAAHQDAIAVDLTGRGLFTFTGPDARRFLNGMFTNNVLALAVGGSNRHGMCDAKGRLIGLLDVWCEEDEKFWAVLDGAPPDVFEARYSKYIVFDDVELQNQGADFALITVVGPGAEQAVARCNVALARARDRSGLGGLDVLVPMGERAATLQALGVQVGTPADLNQLRIAAGLPVFPDDVGERAGPHVMGLVGEIVAFDKGCYVGQETVCRIDSLSKVKRQFTQMTVQSSTVPAVGAEIVAQGKVVGSVSSAARVPEMGVVVLGVIKQVAREAGTQVQIGGLPGVVSL